MEEWSTDSSVHCHWLPHLFSVSVWVGLCAFTFVYWCVCVCVCVLTCVWLCTFVCVTMSCPVVFTSGDSSVVSCCFIYHH